MSNSKSILRNLLDSGGLEDECIPGQSVVELLGDNRVLIENHRRIIEYELERIRIGVSYGFQQPPRFKGMRVRDLLELAAGTKLTRDECCSYLNRVGLCAADYVDREMDTSLSGGEVKRIEIATILARPSGLLIFDEPEAGIDLWSFAKLTETFRMIHARRENTIIVISHQERIIDLADEIVMVSDGKVVRHGPKEELMIHILAETGNGCDFLRGATCHDQDKEG